MQFNGAMNTGEYQQQLLQQQLQAAQNRALFAQQAAGLYHNRKHRKIIFLFNTILFRINSMIRSYQQHM